MQIVLPALLLQTRSNHRFAIPSVFGLMRIYNTRIGAEGATSHWRPGPAARAAAVSCAT
jgi:hypothetical protein